MAPKKMKFEVYCDQSAPAPTVPAPKCQPAAKRKLTSLSRRELQALAKREGIKANLKSAAIIRELQKHGVVRSDKAALQDIENIDPQKLGNRANRQAKAQREPSQHLGEKPAPSCEKAKHAAQMAFEREKARRMKKLMQVHSASHVEQSTKDENSQPSKQTKTDSATQTPKQKLGNHLDNIRKTVAQFVVFNAVYAGTQRAQTELCQNRSTQEVTSTKIKKVLQNIEAGLARQEELKKQLRQVREARKQYQLQHAPRPWVACTPFKTCSKTPSSAKTLPAQLGTREKENVTPGCKAPVRGSSLYYSERRRSTRTPLANISQRRLPTPTSGYRFKQT